MAFFIPMLAAIGGGSAMTGAAVALSAVAAVGAGYSQSQQYKSQANAANYNAIVGRQQSEAALATANQREEQQRRVARLHSGELRASVAQSGVGLDGSNADVTRQSEILAEMDALNIRYEGQVQSTGLLNQSNLDASNASAYKKAAGNAVTMGYVGAATKLLGGYGKAA